MIRHEKRVKPPALQRLNKIHQMLQVKIRVGRGPRVAPPAGMNTDRPHKRAKMQLFGHVNLVSQGYTESDYGMLHPRRQPVAA